MNPSQAILLTTFLRAGIFLLSLSSMCVFALPSDKSQVLHIVADKQDIDLKNGIFIYSGDVKLNQGTLEISAEKITVHKDKNQTTESVAAEGNLAHFQQQPEENKPLIHAEAHNIFYSIKNEQLTMDDNVTIEQNGATTKGGHLEYDIKSQTVKASKGANNPSGRVETVIPPQTDKKE